MKKWDVLYIVESHYAFNVFAETKKEAEDKAWELLENGTNDLDNISSDGGMLLIDEASEIVYPAKNTVITPTKSKFNVEIVSAEENA